MTTLQWDYWPGLLTLGLIALGVFGTVAGLYWTARRNTKPLSIIILVFLRVVLILGILLCLLNPTLVREIRTKEFHDTPPSRLLLLVDTSRSMLEQDGSLSRLARAQHWWRAQKPGTSPEQICGFDTQLYPLKTVETWNATGANGTSLAHALEGISALPTDPPISQVVLISDGHITDGEDPLPAARALGARDIPISTLTLGGTDLKPKIQIEAIDVPPLVSSRTTVRSVVTFSSKGLTGQLAMLRITSGNQVLAEHMVSLSEQPQSIALNFTTPVATSLQICAATLDLATPATHSPHDDLPFVLRVGDRKIRVLYMEGSRPDEMVYLQRALLQGGAPIEVTMLHRGQHLNDHDPEHIDLNVDDGTPIYNVENPVHGYPRDLDSLLTYDVIIWSDIIKEAFTDDQMRMTEQFVEDYGGGFLMIGGSTSYGRGGFERTPIDSIIPVAMENETREFKELFLPVPTAEGLAHPVLSLGTTPEETRQIWQTKSPRIYGFQGVVRPKPGAVILLEHPTMRNEYGPFIILAVQEIGRGRTMAFAPDTTRDGGRDLETLWGEPVNPQLPFSERNCDSRYFRHFWTNAIRWLAARRLATKNPSVTIETSKRRVNADEAFTIRASWKSAVASDPTSEQPPATIDLLVSDLSKNSVVQTLHANLRADTHDYEITTRLPQAGHYLVDVSHVTQNGAVSAPAIITCDTVDPELVDVRANPALMAKIAKASGGHVLSEDSVSIKRLSSPASRSVSAHIEFERHSVWDRWSYLAFLAGLLLFEWILRRRWLLG